MGLNRQLLGKCYRATEPWQVDATEIRAYLAATGADPTPYSSEEPWLAPPIYGVVVARAVMQELILDPDLGIPLARMLHRAQDIRFQGLCRAGDRLHSEAEVLAIEAIRGGEQVLVASRVYREDGGLLYDARIGLFVRLDDVRREPGTRRVRSVHDLPRAVPRGAALLYRCALQTDEEQSRRYADASGDHNPIHLDDARAQAVGFEGRLLHGMCTLAMVHNTLVEQALAGDAARLTRLHAQFSHPVFPGDRIDVAVFRTEQREEGDVVALEVVNAKGMAVLKQGAAVLRRS